MRAIVRIGLAVPAIGVLMFASACNSSDSNTPATSSSATTSVTSVRPSVSTPVSTTTLAPPAAPPAATTPPAQAPANNTGNNLAGQACTDQSGAPGHYIWADSSKQWVCEITGDAPQVNPAPNTNEAPLPSRPDGDPGGTACEDQGGAKGRYIWSESSNMWVCQIS